MNHKKPDYLSEVYPEKIFKYVPAQKRYYKNGDRRCIYPQWGKKYGIHKAGGNFPAMVANDIYGNDLFEQGRAQYRKEKG